MNVNFAGEYIVLQLANKEDGANNCRNKTIHPVIDIICYSSSAGARFSDPKHHSIPEKKSFSWPLSNAVCFPLLPELRHHLVSSTRSSVSFSLVIGRNTVIGREELKILPHFTCHDEDDGKKEETGFSVQSKIFKVKSCLFSSLFPFFFLGDDVFVSQTESALDKEVSKKNREKRK